MSSTISSHQQTPPRTWWSLSSKSPNGKSYSTEKSGPSKSGGLNFNSIASAIGFKPKKHPSLAIQPPPASGLAKQANRPHSKSVSSVWSAADSPQPQTPVDGHRHTRQSLLTLSDVDPFARNGISARHTSSNRHSAHSKASIPEFGSKHADPSIFNRISYASSSSHSNIHRGSELSSSSPKQSSPLTPDTPIQILKPKGSVGSLHRKRSIRSRDGSLVSAWDSLTQAHQPTISKSGSLSTLTDKSRPSQPEPNSRPPSSTRPRGMTDSRVSHTSKFHSAGQTYSHNPSVSNSPISVSAAISPRVIVRQASASRIGSPPSAPPRHELPPPPVLSDEPRDDTPEAALASGGSGSSSSLSFASSMSSNRDIFLNQPYSPRLKEKRSSGRASPSSFQNEVDHCGHSLSKMAQPPVSAPRTLKKALSHQSLTKRGSSSSSPALTPFTSSPERTMEKEPRKQRSFQQPKGSKFSPIRQANLTGSQPPTSLGDAAPLVRGNTSASSRKRLFSGSNLRRPSTAQQLASEDDTLSVFSVRSEQEQASSFVNPVSPATSSSFWDEGTHEHTFESPRRPTHEYTPQQIMSPAEMAKVEASVEESSINGRSRGLSVTSASTSMTSDGDELVVADSLSHSPWHTGTSNSLPLRRNSLMPRGLDVPRRHAARPSTSDAHPTVSSTPTSSKFSFHSTQTITSLPPPPRPRLRPSLVSQAGSLEDGYGAPLPSLPIRRSLRAKSSVEKATYRRSIMKKPSFLEIDDDTDGETDRDSPRETMNSSFLDLARESFDTVRSVSD